MKLLKLSDHAGDKAEQLASARQAAYAAQVATHQAALGRRTLKIDTLRHAARDAWQRRAYWEWLKASAARWLQHVRARPAAPVLATASRDETVWEAGREGEGRVAERLAAQLGDEWTLVTGYKNQKGEIDGVLIGPQAVVAIEIKFMNGVVHVAGDTWMRDKYDKYGNLVELGLAIQDKGGRSPSQQINATADELREFLKSRLGVLDVYRIVVLSHDKAVIGSVTASTLHGIATLDQLDGPALVRKLPAIYDAAMCAAIVEKLSTEHDRGRRARRDRRPQVVRSGSTIV